MSKDINFDSSHAIDANSLIPSAGDPDKLGWIRDKLAPPAFIFSQDGESLELMIKEAIFAFVNDQAFATILLSFSIIEKSLSGQLLCDSKQIVKDKAQFQKIVRNAQEAKLISEVMSNSLLKKYYYIRNAAVHFKASDNGQRLETSKIMEYAQESLSDALSICNLNSI